MTLLTMISRDPFCHGWKRAERVLAEAQRRGFQILLALDERSCGPCTEKARAYDVLKFTPPYDSCGPVIDQVVRAVPAKTVFLLADDEEPSTALWEFASRPTFPSQSWTVRLLAPTPDGRLYEPGTEIQCRVINPEKWRWVGGISGHDDHGGAVGASQKILWHYALHAPRSYREGKIVQYRAATQQDPTTPATQDEDDWTQFSARHFYEDHQDAIVPMPQDLQAQLP